MRTLWCIFVFLAMLSTAAYAQNIALLRPATANVDSGTDPIWAVDGEPNNTMWNSGVCPGPYQPVSLTVDLGHDYQIFRIELWVNQHPIQEFEKESDSWQDYHLYIGKQESVFEEIIWTHFYYGTLFDLPDISMRYDELLEEDFYTDQVVGQYLKFEVSGSPTWAHLNEISINGNLVTPEPFSAVLFILGGGILAVRRGVKRH